MSDKEEFNKRIAGATVDKSGMICLGWNKISPSSPFGKQLIEKNQHIKRAVEQSAD